MTNTLQRYLHDLREIHFSGAGVKETSFYGPLRVLFNDIGERLDPRVRCIIQLRNKGAGLPDGGLFTPDQLPGTDHDKPLLGLTPSRGAIEVKGTGDEVATVADSKQVRDYLDWYGQVLVTNLRDFVLVTQGESGEPVLGESFSLAENQAAFWTATANPDAVAADIGEQFEQYLQRMLLHRAPLGSPRDLAFFMASYARDAKVRIDRTGLAGLSTVRTALEEALGLRFEGERGDHFFRATFVQTLFYGIFSAWVLWSKERPHTDATRFQWRTAAWTLTVPAVQILFEQLAVPTKLQPLGLDRVLDWTEATLNRVDRFAFFTRFEEAEAVQYFYEPFLEAFDPELRRDLGVWYTPNEVVEYMVARVDTALREELGIPDGLADSRVHVLDPCTGTGSFLVAVLKRIEQTLRLRGEDALLANDLKRAALDRIFGFEILPAPFVVAHLQLGLMLQNAGASLSTADGERVGVYLTNALTGWEMPQGPQSVLAFPELQQEREAAQHVKRDNRILVVLGNPPYNGFAGVAIQDERALSDAYRVAKTTKQPQGQGLNDLYVRFFRMAERRIVEMTGEGIVCFISNYSWLDGLSFTAMRERYLGAFDTISIDALNGDKFRTGKVIPKGLPNEGASDPSVFSTPRNREGIQVGTAIALMVRQTHHAPTDTVRFRNLWGSTKLAQLQAEARADSGPSYDLMAPVSSLGLPFLPVGARADYLSWPALTELMPTSFPGVKTSRDDVVVDIDRDRLETRMQRYFDPSVSHEEIRRESPGALESTGRFRAEAAREELVRRGFLPDNVVRYSYRPFDARWLYWEAEANLLDRSRPDYFAQVAPGNLWIEARQKQTGVEFDRGTVTELLADNQGNGLSNFFPLYRHSPTAPNRLFTMDQDGAPHENLSHDAVEYLTGIDSDASQLFFHVVAMLHAGPYRRDNAGMLRQGWPRIPLPNTKEQLSRSAALGRLVADLLRPTVQVRGVTMGTIREELKAIAVIARAGGGTLDPSAGDLTVTARWGYRSKTGAVMAGPGRSVERAYSLAERQAAEQWGNPLGLSTENTFAPLGDATYDVHLNERAYWRNVPASVWHYKMGGYQVIKKWLSYREHDVLGRGLNEVEVREVRDMARRIAALLLLGSRLDANYHAVVTMTHAWTPSDCRIEQSQHLWDGET